MGLPAIFDPTSGANLGDYDNDGWLGLYITNYSFPGVPYTNYLFRNNNGTFVNQTVNTGTGNGIVIDLVSVFFDFNDNGLLDIAVSHSGTEKFHLWENQNKFIF